MTAHAKAGLAPLEHDPTFGAFIASQIRTVPDWPQPGVQFRDITPLLQNPRTLRVLIDAFVYRYMGQKLNYVAGIDARGFILGAIIAYE
ncbi:MAG: adenine phosphoribosyltransferase, partial [Candidatus Protistobacter heckmanni]|nr:adenine phosphoribosyltransferase [Candidatus Protistobacter heckmanni]